MSKAKAVKTEAKSSLGFGYVKPNQYKTKQNHPDVTGTITLNEDLKAGTKVQVSGWNKLRDDGSEFTSISITPEYVKEGKSNAPF